MDDADLALSDSDFYCEHCEKSTVIRVVELRASPAGTYLLKKFMCWDCLWTRNARVPS